MRARLLLPAIPVALVLALTGCVADDAQQLTLVETKSPVQLLRNEAWYRLPDFIVKEASDTIDVSSACDADGFLRSWTSSTIAQVNNSFAPRTAGVADDLIASFIDQGWESAPGAVEEGTTTVLTRGASPATITIHVIEKTDEHRASIAITASGPCVMTDGAESDEVLMLEGRT